MTGNLTWPPMIHFGMDAEIELELFDWSIGGSIRLELLYSPRRDLNLMAGGNLLIATHILLYKVLLSWVTN